MEEWYELIPGEEVTIDLYELRGKKIIGIKLTRRKRNHNQIELKVIYKKDDKQEPGLLYKPNLN